MLSEALRLIRVFHDIKQIELADRLGVSKSHLSEIEAGRKRPTIALIERYSSEFGIPASSILFFSENLAHPLDTPLGARTKRQHIAQKILNFLRILEDRTHHHGHNS